MVIGELFEVKEFFKGGLSNLDNIGSKRGKDAKGVQFPDDGVVIKGIGRGKSIKTLELFQQPGLWSVPPLGCHVVAVPIGETPDYEVGVAAQNFNICPTLKPGETQIFSTPGDGSMVKAKVLCTQDGHVTIANTSKSLKTILTNIATHLKDLTTINCVSGSPVTLSPGTIANLTTDIADLAALLKD